MKVTERKTIFARIGRVTDPDGEALTASEVSKIAEAYKSVGINVYNANGEFQDIDITLSTLSKQWNSLNDAQRSYIKSLICLSRLDMAIKLSVMC